MAFYVDGRGRRGHVATRIWRQPRGIEPKRYMPDNAFYPLSTWRKSYAAAVIDLRLAREGSDYPIYPGHVKRAFDAAMTSAQFGWPDVADVTLAQRLMGESAPQMVMGVPTSAAPWVDPYEYQG